MITEMLKWTVSRSLSTASSTPHVPSKTATRRPFRDLSNTPPASSGSTKISSSRLNENETVANDGERRISSTTKRTPSKKRRCRSQGSDLRGYFQVSFKIFFFFFQQRSELKIYFTFISIFSFSH